MQFRFTLSNDIEGDQLINNPEGWDKIKVKLMRHPKYHSLVEVIDVPLIFYGDNGLVDGGYGYIKRVLETQGLNAIIVCLIENSDDEGATWEEFFEGNLELSDKEEFSEGERFYKLKCPIIQTSLWSNFVNREEIPVDLLSTTDLDGNDTQVPELIELNLIGQTLNSHYNGLYSNNYYWESMSSAAVNSYGAIDFPNETISEIKDKFTLPRGSVSDLADLPELFTVKFAGNYEFDCKISLTNLFYSALTSPTWITGERTDGEIEFYIQINSGTPVKFTSTLRNEAVYGVPPTPPYPNPAQVIDYTYSGNIELSIGDSIKIYWKKIADDGSLYWVVSTGGHLEGGEDTFVNLADGQLNWGDSYLNVTGATIFEDTTTDALLIHDAAKSIVHRITGTPNDSFYSEKLGGIIHGYEFDGCDYKYALMKGKHVRGVSFASKSFFMSWKEFWEGADPIFNLGMGYEEMPPVEDQYGAPFSFGFDLGFES